MQKFIITTENTCDLQKEVLTELNIKTTNLHYFVDGEECPVENFDSVAFYNRFRQGADCSTSQANPADFYELYENILKDGYDILHIAFASVLSGTYSNATTTAKEMLEKYPDRKIYVIDSKSEAGGQGLLVYLTALKQKEGYSLEECRDYAESMIQRINHVFTINDLRTLMKTGRVSGTEAFLGTLLQIKPLLYTDAEGRLTPYSKVISRKLSLNTLCDKVKSLYDGECDKIFISQSDCQKDAEYVANKLLALPGINEVKILPLNPVIGCHTGAETIAIFFTAKDRSIKSKN